MEESTKIFVAYSHQDRDFLQELLKHIAPLIRSNLITLWYDGHIAAGDPVDKIIREKLYESDIFIILVSSDFLSSDFGYDVELKTALERQRQKDSLVIPIIVRECQWNITPLSALQVLPSDGRSISSKNNRDEAWSEVIDKIAYTVADVRERKKLVVNSKNIISNSKIRVEGDVVFGDKIYRINEDEKFDVNEVFPKSGLPKITFVEPISFRQLISSIKHAGRSIVIEGPSGIGKTTALKRSVERLPELSFNYLTARNPQHIEIIKSLPSKH